jgi:hypothetical protein
MGLGFEVTKEMASKPAQHWLAMLSQVT